MAQFYSEEIKRAKANATFHYSKKGQYKWYQTLMDPIGLGWMMPTMTAFWTITTMNSLGPKSTPGNVAVCASLGLYTLTFMTLIRSEEYHQRGSTAWNSVATWASFKDKPCFDIDKRIAEADVDYPVND